MEIEPFYKAPKQLFKSCGFISKVTGEVIPMTQNAKIVLMYMMDRTAFFAGQSLNHFETQATIADACGMECKAAARSLKVFVDHGVIDAVKQRTLAVSPHSQWYYRSVDTSVDLVAKVDESVVSMTTGVVIGKKADDPVKAIRVESVEHDDYSDDFLNSVDYGV